MGHNAASDDPATEARRLRARLIVTLSAAVDNDIDGHDHDADRVFVWAIRLARFEAGLPMMLGRGDRIDEPLRSAMRGIVERAWAEAGALVWDNWVAVARVAAALAVRRDRLSQDELDQIIAKAVSAPEACAPNRVGEFAMQQMIELSGI